jgi:transmembrane sensor
MSAGSSSSVNGAEALNQQAADWLVRQNEGFSRTEKLDFEAWISADPAHERAFMQLEATWVALNEPRETGHAAVLERELAIRRETRARRHCAYAFAAVGVAAAAICMGMFFPRTPVAAPASSTVVVRSDRQILPDGSVVELKSDAEISISFSADARRVRLLQGEALFTVAKDVSRPFVVIAGAVEVRAVGTAFAVRHHTREVAVLVTKGRVAVERVDTGTAAASAAEVEPTYMGPGDRLVVPTDLPPSTRLTVSAMTPQQVAANLAWRGKRVEFTGTTVAEAVRLFNNQNAVQLSIADATIAQMQITGIFWVDDPEGFARLLEAGMNVRVERTARGITLRSL